MMAGFVRGLYSVGARVAAASTVWWMRRKGRWSEESIAQRYGNQLPPARNRPIWIHAASMGEVRVGALLAHALVPRGASVLASAMTETGYELLRSAYPERTTPIRAPFDLTTPVMAVLEHFNPQALVLIETELWPNILAAAAERQVPVFLVNGRLSDKAFPSYRRTRWFWRRILSGVERFYMRSQVDADRVLALGIDPSDVEVSGSLKSTAAPSATAPLSPGDRTIWIAGSTRPGEEEVILAAHTVLKSQFPHLQLWLAPRHPERFDDAAELVRKSGLSHCRLSDSGSQSSRARADVLLIDQMGILHELYSHARIAFVGGSLKPFGGHNPMEPATYGVPVIFGPHMESQHDSAEMLLHHELAVVVNSQAEIVREVASALHEPDPESARKRRVAKLKLPVSGVVDRVADDILRRIHFTQP